MTTNAPNPEAQKSAPQGMKPGEAQSYWTLAARDYRRNKLAMAGLAVIFFIVAVAVHAPLLANQRPLFLKAVMKEQFLDTAFLADEALEKAAASGAKDGADVAARMADFRTRAADLKEHLEDPKPLLDIMGQLEAATSATFDGKTFATAREAYTKAYIDDESPALKPLERYPAFRVLTSGEIFSMAAFWLAVVAFVLNALGVVRSFKGAVLMVALPSLGFAMLCNHLYPPFQDNTPYAKLMAAKDFKGEVLMPLVPFGENQNILDAVRVAPRWAEKQIERAGKTRENPHWFGTDTNGRDVLARMIYGARVAMLVGVFSAFLYVIIGVVVGAIAGFYRGWVDIAISRVIEVVICFPFLMIILSVQAFLAPSISNIVIVLALLSWTGTARLMRGEFLRLVNMDFVQAVRALGGSNLRIIFLHILPNGLGPILVVLSFGIAGAILTESALSFLGFGVPQPTASWGDLLNTSRNDPQGLWWLTLIPGLAIFATVTCLNLIGEGVRDALDPRRDR